MGPPARQEPTATRQPPTATTAVNVFVRVRGGRGDDAACLEVGSGSNGRSVIALDGRRFEFDQAGGREASQARVFDVVGRPTLEAFLGGYNGTILCYGQTGSGKTYTMTGGSRGDRGVLPRMLEEAFAELARRQHDASTAGVSYHCTCSHLEIHNEHITDLLAPLSPSSSSSSSSLRVREAPDPRGTFVEGLKEVRLRTAAEALNALTTGNKRRAVASTLMNSASSRSHAVFILRLQRVTRTGGGPQCVRTSQLNLVDLAGSERQLSAAKASERSQEMAAAHVGAPPPATPPRTTAATSAAAPGSSSSAVSSALPSPSRSIVALGAAEAERAERALLQEACSINKSLSALSSVIHALNSGRAHVPYRDSKLTQLLRDSLGGSARTWLIANLNPLSSCRSETLSTLLFAQRAQQVRNRHEQQPERPVAAGEDVGSQSDAVSSEAPPSSAWPSPLTSPLLARPVAAMAMLAQEASLGATAELATLVATLQATIREAEGEAQHAMAMAREAVAAAADGMEKAQSETTCALAQAEAWRATTAAALERAKAMEATMAAAKATAAIEVKREMEDKLAMAELDSAAAVEKAVAEANAHAAEREQAALAEAHAATSVEVARAVAEANAQAAEREQAALAEAHAAASAKLSLALERAALRAENDKLTAVEAERLKLASNGQEALAHAESEAASKTAEAVAAAVASVQRAAEEEAAAMEAAMDAAHEEERTAAHELIAALREEQRSVAAECEDMRAQMEAAAAEHRVFLERLQSEHADVMASASLEHQRLLVATLAEREAAAAQEASAHLERARALETANEKEAATASVALADEVSLRVAAEARVAELEAESSLRVAAEARVAELEESMAQLEEDLFLTLGAEAEAESSQLAEAAGRVVKLTQQLGILKGELRASERQLEESKEKSAARAEMVEAQAQRELVMAAEINALRAAGAQQSQVAATGVSALQRELQLADETIAVSGGEIMKLHTLAESFRMEATSLRACVLERDDELAALSAEAEAASSAQCDVLAITQARLMTAEAALKAEAQATDEARLAVAVARGREGCVLNDINEMQNGVLSLRALGADRGSRVHDGEGSAAASSASRSGNSKGRPHPGRTTCRRTLAALPAAQLNVAAANAHAQPCGTPSPSDCDSSNGGPVATLVAQALARKRTA